jgi:hypothetical protein
VRTVRLVVDPFAGLGRGSGHVHCEQHGLEKWLVVGTSRIAPDEYIISKTLLEKRSLQEGSL